MSVKTVKRVQLCCYEKTVLQNIRWRIDSLGPDADEFDMIAFGYIESLLTGYGSRQKGGQS